MAKNLPEIQSMQAEFDTSHWAHQAGNDTLRHSQIHLAKLLGKLATVVERQDHGEEPDTTIVDTEVIPDLLAFAARLANDRGLDLESLYDTRTAALQERFTS